MTGLVLTLREPPRQRVDMAPLTLRDLAGRSVKDVASLTLACGNRSLRVDELFDVSGTMVMPREQGRLTIRNGSPKLDRVGFGMTDGNIAVEGDVGAYAGMGMTGGNLRISGSAGPFAACVMEGGALHIGGNADEFLGSALPGDRVGMRGGVVSVDGNAGARAGDHLRRGMLLIAGDAGPYCGARMIAGTILVLGEIGDFIGLGMKRGTIMLSHEPARLLATFNDCGSHQLQFLPLLFEAARNAGPAFASLGKFGSRVRRFAGDRGVGGQGEILIRES